MWGQSPSKLSFAFTLAEVLITLSIIGIVAAMTLPALVQKQLDKELIVRTKKTYSEISNALLAAQNDFGVIGDNSFLFDKANTSAQTAEKLVKYFNSAVFCENSSSKNCSKYYYDVNYATLQLGSDDTALTDDSSNLPKIILSNGAVLRVYQIDDYGEKCYHGVTANKVDAYGRPLKNPDGTNQTITYSEYHCGYIAFDVNGPKRPNQYGRDAYEVIVAGNTLKLLPTNTQHGSKSLLNILTGTDKLEYTTYQKGQKIEF